MKAKGTRRIVTGHRPDGRSAILSDGPAPNVKQRAAGNASTLLWVTEESPADVSGAGDRAARDVAVPPPRRGTVFRIAEFPPGMEAAAPDNATLLRDFGIDDEVLRGRPPRDPAIHRTRSLDYVVVLEGEITLLLDEGETTLCPGDVVVQQGTNHAWVNRGSVPCRLAMVFVDAEEPGPIRALDRSR